jgi:hypothetical protein
MQVPTSRRGRPESSPPFRRLENLPAAFPDEPARTTGQQAAPASHPNAEEAFRVPGQQPIARTLQQLRKKAEFVYSGSFWDTGLPYPGNHEFVVAYEKGIVVLRAPIARVIAEQKKKIATAHTELLPETEKESRRVPAQRAGQMAPPRRWLARPSDLLRLQH